MQQPLDPANRAVPAGSAAGWLAGAAGGLWLPALVLFAGSLLIRLVGLDRPPEFDELYHLLAARGWLVEGVPSIAEGVYDRAWLFTRMVAWMIGTFGDSLLVLRAPSVIAGSLLVVAVFAWVHREAGPLAAWITALIMALSPLSIQMSQFGRFYALHSLLFWLAAIAIYALAIRGLESRARAVGLALGAAVALLVAFHLQALTLLGLAGLAIWLALAVGLPWLLGQERRVVWGVVGLLPVAAAALLLVLAAVEPGAGLVEAYRSAPLHLAPYRNEIWFYHLRLIEHYPSLWPLLPFLALLALAVWPRPALFCLVVFATGFALLSFAGMKHFRYLYLFLPFLAVIWGLALAAVAVRLARFVVTVTDQALERVAPRLPRRPARTAVITLGVIFLVLANGASARTLLLPFGLRLEAERAAVDWAAVQDSLAPWLERAAVVLTTQELHALYHFGRFDITVSASRVSEVEGGEFDPDPRTGRPVISRPDSLELVMACYPSGLVLSPGFNWGNPVELPPATASVVVDRAEPIALPPRSNILAFYWEHADAAAPPAPCAALPELAGG